MGTKKKQTALYFSLASLLVLGSSQALAGNTAYGTNALVSITTGDNDSAFGEGALRFNTSGYNNTASGALDSLTQQETINRQQEDRMLQMEMALAELQRNQSSENQVGLSD